MRGHRLPLFILIACAVFLVAAVAQRPPGAEVVASINGEAITAAELDAVTSKQIQELQQQVERLKQSALNRLIDNLLLAQAARAEGFTVEEYLRRNVESAVVSTAEVEEAYERSKAQFPGVIAPEIKYRIRRTLEDNRRAEALRRILQRLRRQARVTNYLLEGSLAGVAAELDQGPSRGDPNAPVTIIEFADFECPFCRGAKATLDRLLETTPAQVRFVFKHFPLDQHANAFGAAKAAVCAERQGLFWPFHDTLFREGQGLSGPELLAIASSLGTDMTAFKGCLDSNAAAERVQRDIAVARAAGVAATPAFFVNHKPVSDVRELESAVMEALSRPAAAAKREVIR